MSLLRRLLRVPRARHHGLARDGHPTALRLGVGRDAGGRFAAHAWIEDAHGILIGAPEAAGFTPLPLAGESRLP
jgi:hypothetical protein